MKLIVLLLGLSVQPVFADVYINGNYISPDNVAILEQLGGGERIADGHYWMDLSNGTWGYGDYPSASDTVTTTTSSPYFEDRTAESIASMGYSIPSSLNVPVNY